VLLKKAWWNYQLIAYGSADGMHNAKYAIDVLTKTYAALGGIIPVELLGFTAEMNNGIVSLKWETATETNNRGFEIQRKTVTTTGRRSDLFPVTVLQLRCLITPIAITQLV